MKACRFLMLTDWFEEMIRNWLQLVCTSFRIKWVKQPRLSQFRLRSAVVIAPVNNIVINNDVASSHRPRRMDSMSNIEGIVGIEGIEGIEGIKQWAFDTKSIEVSRYH